MRRRGSGALGEGRLRWRSGDDAVRSRGSGAMERLAFG